MATKILLCLICSRVVASSSHLLQNNPYEPEGNIHNIAWKMKFKSIDFNKNLLLILVAVVVTLCLTLVIVSLCYVCINVDDKEDIDKNGGAQMRQSEEELLSIKEFKSQMSEAQLNDIDDDESVDENIRLEI
eukprot:UN13735